jgi:hypothetical protein
MGISDKALDEFIEIYREEFGEKIDRSAATEMAQRVLALYRLLRRKLPENTMDDNDPIGFQTYSQAT